MHQIGVVGLSYRHAGVDQVARFAVPRTEVPARLPALRTLLKAAEILYVGTCNRVEVVYATDDGTAAGDSREDVFRILTGRDPQPGEAARILRAWTGEAAVEHLLLLACGLDSAQLGEHEIAAQLRGAWEDSRAARTCGPLLDRLMGEALGMARRVRRLSAGVRSPSLGDLAADRVLQHLGGRPGRVALLGVSPMTRRCAAVLHEARIPLLIVNRTLQAAEELARSVSGEALALERFRAPSNRSPPRKWRVRSGRSCVHWTISNADSSSGSRPRWRTGSRICRSRGCVPPRCMARMRWRHSSKRPRRAVRAPIDPRDTLMSNLRPNTLRESRHPRSAELYQRACRVIPGGVNSPVRAFRAVGGTPLFIARGAGAQVFDADGRAYLDLVGSWGPLIAGHAHPAVLAAVTEALSRGMTYGAPCAEIGRAHV